MATKQSVEIKISEDLVEELRDALDRYADLLRRLRKVARGYPYTVGPILRRYIPEVEEK